MVATIVLIVILLLAGLILFLVAPGKRRDTGKFERKALGHRGLHDNPGGIPENSLAAFRRARWCHCTTRPRKRKERKGFLCCATVNCVDCTNICENTPAMPKFLSIFMYCFPKKLPI